MEYGYSLEVASPPAGRVLEELKAFLTGAGLGFASGIEHTALVRDGGGRIAAAASLAGNVVKCVAVDPALQGEGLTATLLTALRDCRLKDREPRQALYQKIIDSLELEGANYLLLLACDVYDVPRRGRDGQDQDSEEVFPYLLCCVCPLKMGKPELNYFPGDNEFHCAVAQVVSPPELGFLFPAFDNRSANIYNALFYARKPDQIHQEVIDAVFRTEPPMSAAEQRETFQNVLVESLEDSFSVEVAQAVHEQLTGRILQHKESKDPEPLALTARDVGAILQDCGVVQERVEGFQSLCDQRFGAGAALSPSNLIDASRFELKTAQATVSLPPESSYLVETRIIDGKKYILIPAEEDVEVNGLAVRFPEEEKADA